MGRGNEMNVTSEKNPMDRWGPIVAGLAISIIGALIYNLLPLFLGSAQDSRGLSDAQLGNLSASYFIGWSLAPIPMFFWIRRVSWRTVTMFVLPLIIVGLLASVLYKSQPALFISILAAGGGLGVLYGIGATSLGDTTHAARWFGIKIALEGMAGAVLFLFLPVMIVQPYGFKGLIYAVCGVIALMTPLLLFLPAQGIKGGVLDRANSELDEVESGKPVAIWLGLFATLLFMGGQTTIWAFAERIGNGAGYDAAAVGQVLFAALVSALSGSFLVAIIADRFGFARPIGIACTIFAIAMAVLLRSDTSFAAFAIGACLVMFSVGFGLPVAISLTESLDADGRHIMLTVPLIGLGAMAGPAIASRLTSGGSYVPVLVFGLAAVAASLLLFLVALKLGSTSRSTVPGQTD